MLHGPNTVMISDIFADGRHIAPRQAWDEAKVTVDFLSPRSQKEIKNNPTIFL
jgi:hypothetical protein